MQFMARANTLHQTYLNRVYFLFDATNTLQACFHLTIPCHEWAALCEKEKKSSKKDVDASSKNKLVPIEIKKKRKKRKP